MDAASEWPEAIHRALGELGVRQVAYVPDAGHARLIELCQADPALRAIVLTTEEEGVALAAGAWLGGQRAVLLMQSSGVGNCVNMLALNQVGRFPLLALVTMRGEWGEQNPWQLPMGQSTADVLKLAGVIVQRLDAPESAARNGARRRRDGVRGAGPGRGADRPAPDRRQVVRAVSAMDASASERFPLRRRELAKALLAEPGDLLVVAGLGSTAWDVTAAGDRPLNFPLWGAMGGAAMVGLGLALAQPRAPGPGDYRRRRAAHGPRQPRHDRRPAAAQSRDRGVRQRALRRDRHAGDPHRAGRRSRRGRRGLRLSAHRHAARAARGRCRAAR